MDYQDVLGLNQNQEEDESISLFTQKEGDGQTAPSSELRLMEIYRILNL
jgi:hypothetical protein